MTRPLALAAPAALICLAGCAEPMIPDSDVIRHAAEPAYTYDEGGRLAASSCRADRPSSYSGTPSACQRDVVFARQVANPADLIQPRTPGQPVAGPVGAAADAYLYRAGRTPWASAAGGGGGATAASPATAWLPPVDPYSR